MEDAYWQKTENRRKQKGRVKFTHEDGKLGLLILSSHITKKKRGGGTSQAFLHLPHDLCRLPSYSSAPCLPSTYVSNLLFHFPLAINESYSTQFSLLT